MTTFFYWSGVFSWIAVLLPILYYTIGRYIGYLIGYRRLQKFRNRGLWQKQHPFQDGPFKWAWKHWKEGFREGDGWYQNIGLTKVPLYGFRRTKPLERRP